MVNTMIPMPPIHWRKDLQNRIPFGKLSIPLARFGSVSEFPRIEAPVVVTPDIDSNHASV